MASNDPGLAPFHAANEPLDDLKLILDDKKGDGIAGTSSILDDERFAPVSNSQDHPIAPDQFDPKYETSRWEIWAYYAYYIGNNGLTLFNFAPTAFQNLLSQAAGDAGIIHFAGADRTINSVVLSCNGISFAIQIVIFLVIGSYAGMTL